MERVLAERAANSGGGVFRDSSDVLELEAAACALPRPAYHAVDDYRFAEYPHVAGGEVRVDVIRHREQAVLVPQDELVEARQQDRAAKRRSGCGGDVIGKLCAQKLAVDFEELPAAMSRGRINLISRG